MACLQCGFHYTDTDFCSFHSEHKYLLQGKVEVNKDVLYADRARYFPWRPRFAPADKDILLYSGIAQAVLLAWALLTPLTAGTQPVVWGETLGLTACATLICQLLWRA